MEGVKAVSGCLLETENSYECWGVKMRIEEKGGEFVIVDFDELEAYKIARKIERDGLNFYKKLLEKAVEEKTKKALAFLIEKEREHLNFFGDRLSEIREKKDDSFEEDDLLGTIDYGIFQPYQSMEQLEKALDDPRKALRLGLIVENHSIKFYKSCRDKVTSEKTKEEMTRIIEDECEHKAQVEGMLGKL